MSIEAPNKPRLKVGPADHGRAMSLDDFEFCEVEEGHVYELSRGRIEVSDVPDEAHAQIEEEIRDQLVSYKLAHRDRVFAVRGGSSAKTVVEATESERHPDLSVYLTPPPNRGQPWRGWVAELVIEVVSETSAQRDYADKSDDYYHAGVTEYLIVDRFKPRLRVHVRERDGWHVKDLHLNDVYQSVLLPGFELNLERLFARK